MQFTNQESSDIPSNQARRFRRSSFTSTISESRTSVKHSIHSYPVAFSKYLSESSAKPTPYDVSVSEPPFSHLRVLPSFLFAIFPTNKQTNAQRKNMTKKDFRQIHDSMSTHAMLMLIANHQRQSLSSLDVPYVRTNIMVGT